MSSWQTNNIMSQQSHTFPHSILFTDKELNHFYRYSITLCSLPFKFWQQHGTPFNLTNLRVLFRLQVLTHVPFIILSQHLPTHYLPHTEPQFLVCILFKHLQGSPTFFPWLFSSRPAHPKESKGSHNQCPCSTWTIQDRIVPRVY